MMRMISCMRIVREDRRASFTFKCFWYDSYVSIALHFACPHWLSGLWVAWRCCCCWLQTRRRRRRLSSSKSSNTNMSRTYTGVSSSSCCDFFHFFKIRAMTLNIGGWVWRWKLNIKLIFHGKHSVLIKSPNLQLQFWPALPLTTE